MASDEHDSGEPLPAGGMTHPLERVGRSDRAGAGLRLAAAA